MAKFCASCGFALQEDLRFCPNCGKPIGAAAAPPPAAPAPPRPLAATATQRLAAPQEAPPPKKGSSAVKIILIVVGVIAFLTVASMATCFYVAYRFQQKAKATLESAGANSKAAAQATVDVPAYPDSTPTKAGGGMSIGGLGSISVQEFVTDDPVDKVLDFYKGKFGTAINVYQTGSGATFNLKVGNASTTVAITRDEQAQKTKITITRAQR